MQNFRSWLAGLFSLLCALAITALVWLVTLQTTILDRTVVKGWVANSSVYGEFVTRAMQDTSLPSNNVVTPAIAQQALAATFTPNYVQSEAERVIDATYDWLEGKQPTIEFAIPVQDKRPTFVEQLTGLLQPVVANLPVCSGFETPPTAENITCRPSSSSIADFARQIATEGTQRAGTLEEPLTEQTAGPALTPNNTPQNSIGRLPSLIQAIQWLAVTLPIIIVVSLMLALLIAPQRLLMLRRLGKRIFFGTLLTVLIAGFVWAAGSSLISLDRLGTSVADLFGPVVRTAISEVAGRLMFYAGLAALGGLLLWITFGVLHAHRRRSQNTMPQAQPRPPETPTAPSL